MYAVYRGAEPKTGTSIEQGEIPWRDTKFKGSMKNPNIVSNEAYNDAYRKIGSSDSQILDTKGHSFFYYYQAGVLQRLPKEDIVLGILAGYQRDACNANHFEAFADCLPTDECRMFRHPEIYGGGSDHFNMRWFKEWCEINNPQLIKSVFGLKVFW